MFKQSGSALVLIAIGALAGCAKPAPPAADTAADESAVKSINQAWFEAYNAGDADKLASFYSEDALLLAPGAPAVRGNAAIREYFAADVAASTAAGLKNVSGTSSEIGISGDLAWESNTFSVTDASGATVDNGKYLTVFRRKGEGWTIIRDTWNSDKPPAAPSTAPADASAAPSEPGATEAPGG